METLSDKNLDIMILEDDPTSMATLQALLHKTSLVPGRIDHSETLSTALSLLRKNPSDLVLLDLNLPDSSGLDTLRVLSESYPYVPIVVVTGQSDESLGLKSLRSGAQDYLVKGKYTVEILEKTVKYALERKAVEEKISRQNKFLNDILSAITHPFVSIDVNDYSVTMANPAAKKLISGRSDKCYLIFHNRQQPCENCPVEQVRRTGKPVVVERCIQDKNGAETYYEIHAYPVFDNDAKVSQVIEYSVDITKRIQAENENRLMESQLAEAQKMEAIGTLAGGIAHDFNNMLGALIGYANLAAMDTEKDSEVNQNIQQVLIAANRAKQLVRQILTFGRETDEPALPVQIAPLIKETVKTLSATLPGNIEVRQNTSGGDSTILANIIHIHQILMNLCTNAIHAMEQTGGILEINLEDVRVDSEVILDGIRLEKGGYVKLSIKDSGSGMTQEVKERIFEPFFTTKDVDKGTGMGLSVVHGIIRKYGGLIGVESSPGSGTVFTIFFPTVQSQVVADEVFVSRQPDSKNKPQILLVEDEQLVLEVMDRTLTRFGYFVDAVNNPLDAIEVFRLHPERYDLIITDHRMPGITGLEMAKMLIAIRGDIPIVMCTGFSGDIGPDQAEQAGIRRYIMKPVTKDELLETIENVLSEGVKI